MNVSTDRAHEPRSSFSERLHEIRTGFERPFWVANISELFERLSYYAAFASLARYLHETLNFGVKQAGSLTGLFGGLRSEEHTSELQSRGHLVCRLLLEKKNIR